MNAANVWAYKPSSTPAKKFFPEYYFRLAGRLNLDKTVVQRFAFHTMGNVTVTAI